MQLRGCSNVFGSDPDFVTKSLQKELNKTRAKAQNYR